MHHTTRRRGLISVGVVAVALAALGGGLAYATSHSTGDTIAGCVKESGLLRIVSSESACTSSETAISWPARGTAGYRALFSAPPASNIEVTAVGAAPVGFPAEGESETPVLRFDLPAGKYLVGVTLGVSKSSGNAELLCYIRLPGNRLTAFLRTALGTDTGSTRLTTVHSDGVMNDWPGGSAELGCIQDGSQPGSPTGENPQVFYATVTASELGSFSFVNAP